MSESIMVGMAASVLIPYLIMLTLFEQRKQGEFRKSVDEKMHTHAADGSIQGIRGWY